MGPVVSTYIYASDPISQAGVASQLRCRDGIRLVEAAELDRADVAVVVTGALDPTLSATLRALQRGGVPRTVLVAELVDDQTVVAAAEAGVSGIVRRADATGETLERVVRKVAAGRGEIPDDLVARLLEHVGTVQREVLAPRGMAFAGLSDRETDVLRMVAEGLDTADIAARLNYSDRTVKNVLHGVMSRLQLRNRSHAVAYAVREGLI